MVERLGNGDAMTGGAFDFNKATTSLTERSISISKKVTLVRHGLSTWNEESRVQVCSVPALIIDLFDVGAFADCSILIVMCLSSCLFNSWMY